MKVSGIFLFILILSSLSGPRCGATVYNSNGTAASVQFLHNNSAQNGDTITLPAGTFTWSTRVRITKAITLQGAGVGNTIIKDAMQSGKLIQWTLAANQVSRLTGIEFQDGGRPALALAPGGIIHVDGSNTNGGQFRLDHCKWNDLNGLLVADTVLGVIDHNNIVMGGHANGFICIYGTNWNGDTGGNGDKSWTEPANYGTGNFLFLEDNTTRNLSPTKINAFTDAFAGARYVVRHNTFGDVTINNHGTESRRRSGRAIEIYDNVFNGTNRNRQVGGIRGGGVLIHHNTITGYQGAIAVYSLNAYRQLSSSVQAFGGADGTNTWDRNFPVPPNNGPFTVTATGSLRVTVSGANWTTNQWRHYSVKRDAGGYALITRNTKNTITYAGPFMGSNLGFAVGETFHIYRVNSTLDQPGVGAGPLISAGTSPTRPPAGWNTQAAEPCYSWNNTSNGSPINLFAPDNRYSIRRGEHYFNGSMPGYTPYVYPHPLVAGAGSAVTADFNGDGRPDFALQNASTGQTAVWYMDNNTRINSAFGPTPWAGWNVAGVADFNNDGHPDYLLFSPSTGQTAIWYLNNNVRIFSAFGPTPWAGWNVAGVADFNGDGHPDYLLFSPITGQTAIWYLNNNVRIFSAFGPTPWAGWSVAGVADFNNDGHPDYLLFNPSTGQTVIWYLNNNALIGHAYGPTAGSGWSLVAP